MQKQFPGDPWAAEGLAKLKTATAIDGGEKRDI